MWFKELMGLILVKILIVEYIVIGVVFMLHRDFARALYFLSAASISASVLWMK